MRTDVPDLQKLGNTTKWLTHCTPDTRQDSLFIQGLMLHVTKVKIIKYDV